MPTVTLKLDEVSYVQWSGPDPVSVQFRLGNGNIGSPITISSGVGFISAPPDAEINFGTTKTMDAFVDGMLVCEGAKAIMPVPEPGDIYGLIDNIGDF